MTDTAIEQRDEQVAEAITSGRSLRSVRKQFGLSTTELDSALERLWPIDLQSRIRMIKGDLGKLDKLTEVFYVKALAGDVQSGLLTVRIWERKHELLGMNSAAKIEIIQAPLEAPTSYDKIKEAIMSLKYSGNGDGALPPDGNGSGGPAASDTSKTS